MCSKKIKITMYNINALLFFIIFIIKKRNIFKMKNQYQIEDRYKRKIDEYIIQLFKFRNVDL